MAVVSSREFFSSRWFRVDTLKVFILLAVMTWVAHFWYCQSFGLYEDDLYKITPVMGVTGLDLWKLILRSGWEGRPLQDSFIYLLSSLGLQWGGLHFVYGFGYIIVAANACLFYVFLKHLSDEPIFAVSGALAFCLFPADTTQAFLTHALGLQPSLTFLLIAFLCYLSGKKMISYGVILGSLLCYETMYILFLMAPLLKKKWDSKLIREWGLHALILGAILVCAFCVRRFVFGEVRCVKLGVLEALHLSMGHMLKGPIVSLFMFFYRPAETLLTLNGTMTLPLSLCFAGLVWILFQLRPGTLGVGGEGLRLRSSGLFSRFAKLAWIGLIMLILAYPITFTTEVTNTAFGRESRVHAAAVVGASILCACSCSFIFLMASAYWRRALAALGLAVFFTLLVGFGLTVQRDYKTSWQHQRVFWTDVVTLCPDMTDRTVILVESENLKDPQQIKAHFTCYFPMMLESIYQFPNVWKDVPRVYALLPGWQERVGSWEGFFILNKIAIWQPFQSQRFDDTIESTRVILLESRNGQLNRRTEPLIMNGQEFKLKESSVITSPPFSKGPLFSYLIKDSGERPVAYLTQ